MSWPAAVVTLLLILSAGYLLLAAYVWMRPAVAGSRPLVVMLLAVTVWSFCYALELSCDHVGTAQWWSALKYLGIVALPPALWSFVRQYTGRGPLPRRVFLALMVEPVLVLGMLAIPATHDLIQNYHRSDLGRVFSSPMPKSGSLFWIQAGYTYLLMLGAVSTLLFQLSRVAPPYRRQGAVLMVASVLPFIGNLLWNAERLGEHTPDPTVFLFGFTAVVLVWGFFRLRLLDLLPVARGVVLEQMADGVLLLDAYDRVVDANPAGASMLHTSRTGLVGRWAVDLLPGLSGVLARSPHDAGVSEPGAPGEVRAELQVVPAAIEGPPSVRDLSVSLTAVTDPAGRQSARLLVMRDITDRKRTERRLRELLDEQTRLSETFRQTLRPASLPEVPGLRLAARSIPAARGGGVSGDFYDVHPAGPGRSAFVLGDVSGRGVQAAVVTSMARYTVRTLSNQGWSPRQVLDQLNRAMLATDDLERFCTVVYGHILPRPMSPAAAPDGAAGALDQDLDAEAAPGDPPCPQAEPMVRLRLVLGGHPPPLLRRRDASVQPVGEPGTALGLLPQIDVHEVDVDLASGDLVLAYTDGVTEARQHGEQFGEERLSAVISAAGRQLLAGAGTVGHHRAGLLASEVADGVVSAVRAFADEGDDMALLVLAVP